MRRLLLAIVTASTWGALIAACTASGGDIIPAGDPREAGSVDAPGARLPEGGSTPEDDGSSPSKNDGSTAKDAGDGGGSTNNAVVVISEIYVDNDGLGDGAEFVEIQGPPNTPVDDLRLRLIDKNGLPKYTSVVGEAGDKIGAGGFWVVSGNQCFKLGVSPYREDQTYSLANWGLDNERGAIQLIRGANTLLDVVGFSDDADAATIPSPGTGPAATVEGTRVTIPTIAKHSFGRKAPAGATDTNNNAADFCSMVATPGYAPKPCD